MFEKVNERLPRNQFLSRNADGRYLTEGYSFADGARVTSR